MSSYKLHVVSLPHLAVNQDSGQDAFTQNLVTFRKMFSDSILYSNEGTDGDFVQIYSKSDLDRHFSKYDWYQKGEIYKVSFDYTLDYWTEFNSRAIGEIKKRIAPKDIICLIGGLAHKQIADAFPDNLVVEHAIGYEGSFSKYRVFESYAWMHYIYGKQGINDGRFFDSVIPPAFDPEDFEFSQEKDNYLLFLSRPIERKGIEIVKEIAKRGHRVIAAGAEEIRGENIEWVGYADKLKKSKLIARAKAVLMPTLYIEPGGKVSLEAGFGGTPIITTDWGCFSETVENGMTGYRCRTLGEFIYAIDADYDYQYIQNQAIRRFGLTQVKSRYKVYFDRLQTLFQDGWYSVF